MKNFILEINFDNVQIDAFAAQLKNEIVDLVNFFILINNRKNNM